MTANTERSDSNLDRAVAEAMGWKRTTSPAIEPTEWLSEDGYWRISVDDWKPSTDDACAMRALRWLLEQSDYLLCHTKKGWDACSADGAIIETHPNLNLAICHAVIAEVKHD